jgi:hypothetical protein
VSLVHVINTPMFRMNMKAFDRQLKKHVNCLFINAHITQRKGEYSKIWRQNISKKKNKFMHIDHMTIDEHVVIYT